MATTEERRERLNRNFTLQLSLVGIATVFIVMTAFANKVFFVDPVNKPAWAIIKSAEQYHKFKRPDDRAQLLKQLDQCQTAKTWRFNCPTWLTKTYYASASRKPLEAVLELAQDSGDEVLLLAIRNVKEMHTSE